MAIITVFLIMNVSQNKKTLVKLENRVMDYLGKISYGIYIYHPLVIFLGAKLLTPYFLKMGESYQYIAIYVFIFGGTILLAGISYVFFEKRFIRLKGKFTRIKSSPSINDPHPG